MNNEMGFVIIGRNEGERLRQCFQSLRAFKDATIVYVDSGSSDGSVRLARSFNVDVVELDLARPFTAARARNAGYALLRERDKDCQFVQFLDGDCELVESWISTASNFLRSRDDVAIACGRRREKYPRASIYNILIDIEWNTPIGEASACGGDALVRAVAFDQVSGFDAILMAGEEPDLCRRLIAAGWKIWRLDHDMSRHDADMHFFKQWWMRGMRAGYALIQIVLLRSSVKTIVYGRELARAIFWALVLPIAIVLGSIVTYWSLALSTIYLIQIARIRQKTRVAPADAWKHSIFVVLDNFPLLFGIIRYIRAHLFLKEESLIEYKGTR